MKISRTAKPFLLVTIIVCFALSALAQVDVSRKLTAITYPLDDSVTVQFRGTTQFPRMKGDAKVKRSTRSGTKIELSVEKMPRPFELGAGYATYILWAISPTGHADNLGEIKRSGLFFIDSKITVTTTLQTFALIITAEPHFRVTRPSQKIMLENLYPVAENGKRIPTSPSITFFGNSSDYFRDPRTPDIAQIDYEKTPSAILQAKQAVALAKFAGAERDASTELNEAEILLQNAQNAWEAGRDNDTIDIAARRAIDAAINAEAIAGQRKEAREKRNEQTRTDAEIRAAENKFVTAQSQVSDLREELAREVRNRELAERDAMNYSNQLREIRDENGRLREEIGRIRVEVESAKAKLAAAEKEKTDIEQQGEREKRVAAVKANEAALIASLKPYGTVAKTDRGIVLTMPESYWVNTRSIDATTRGNGKLSALGEVLASNPDYRISIESHSDNSGDLTQIQTMTERRSYTVAEKLSAMGVDEGRIVAKGFGSQVPVAANNTAANRAKNRRIQLILSVYIP